MLFPTSAWRYFQQCHLQNRGLEHGHFFRFIRLVIIQSCEMQQTVDHVERELMIETLAMLGSLTLCGACADEYLTMMEGDDIRGCRVFEELAMHAGNLFIADKGDLDLLQHANGSIGENGLMLAGRQGGAGDFFEPRKRRLVPLLVIVEMQTWQPGHHAAEAGGFLCARFFFSEGGVSPLTR